MIRLNREILVNAIRHTKLHPVTQRDGGTFRMCDLIAALEKRGEDRRKASDENC